MPPILSLEFFILENSTHKKPYIGLSPTQFSAASHPIRGSHRLSVFAINLLWGVLCGMSLWYSLTPDCQDSFLFRAVKHKLYKGLLMLTLLQSEFHFEQVLAIRSQLVGRHSFGKPLFPKIFTLWFIAEAILHLWSSNGNNYDVNMRNCIKGSQH